MTRARRIWLGLGVLLTLAAAAALGQPVRAIEGMTRVRGTVVDDKGKPLAKVPLYFDAADIKKRVGPVKTNKSGGYIIATLDISVAKRWRVVPEFPGYKVVKVSILIIDSEGSETDKREYIPGASQEIPDARFVLVGSAGRNQIDLVLAKDADFDKAVQAARKERQGESGEEAPPEGQAQAEPAAPPPGSTKMLEQAKNLADAGKHQEALGLYSGYLAKDPTGNPAAYYYYGKSLFETGQNEQAEAALKKCLELNPEIKGAHFFLGNIYMRQERFADAAGEYEQEAMRSPDQDVVLYNLAEARNKVGDKEQALTAYQKAAELNPSRPEPLMQMAAIYEERGDTAKRDEIYEQVKAVDPKNAAVLFYNIGARAWNENRAKEAAQAFNKSIEIDPSYAPAHRELARALMGSGDFPGALKHFREYLRLEPAAPDAKEIQANIALLQ